MTDSDEEQPQPEDYDDPFDYALALGNSAEAMQVVWDRWKSYERVPDDKLPVWPSEGPVFRRAVSGRNRTRR